MKPINVLVLAAGQGSRMKSALPKVLHPVAGRPMIEHVLRAVEALKPRETAIVLGVGREKVKASLESQGWRRLRYAVQSEPKGSGHAVLMARDFLRAKKGTLLIVYGDTPLLTSKTLARLVAAHNASTNAATFLAMEFADPSGYGRMVLDSGGWLEKIVEDKDATADEKKITLVNSGVACWDIEQLLRVLPRLRPNNAKHEYYLTDAAGLLRDEGHRVGVIKATDAMETRGINTRIDLAECEAICRRQVLEKWMRNGVTIVDPATTYIDTESELSPDCRIWPGTMIQGRTRIGSACEIGPYSILEDAVVHEGAKVGPFARVRPGSVIGKNARVGNFVETKNIFLGEGSKANHLTYLGDAKIGKRVNIGAGTITCNYNGFSKNETWIEDEVFIGSNTNLVAPVRLGRGSIVAAGSTLTKNVKAGDLAIARSPQTAKNGWATQFRARHTKESHA